MYALSTLKLSAMNPVQYLGSKVQVLPKILELYDAHARQGTAVDLFSGSSVVSQALALRSSVAAVDASPASKALFEGMVCGRMEGRTNANPSKPSDPGWTSDQSREAELLASHDADGLIQLYQDKHREFQENYKGSQAWWDKNTENGASWVSTLYGGHFFGLRQASELDALRCWIAENELQGTPYQTALLSTASRLVASAGKHFASVLNFHGGDITPFVKRRLLDDRRRSVFDTYWKVLDEFHSLGPLPHQKACEFHQLDLANPDFGALSDVGFVYADPPYTTDQYSRFYHLLDSLARDDYFELSLRSGAPTKGRYPKQRMHSPFSHEGQAVDAFDRLFEAVSALDAPFVFSYSAPRAEGSRDRTVGLSDLERLLDKHFSEVPGFEDLDHGYRPLQPGAKMQASATETIVVALP